MESLMESSRTAADRSRTGAREAGIQTMLKHEYKRICSKAATLASKLGSVFDRIGGMVLETNIWSPTRGAGSGKRAPERNKRNARKGKARALHTMLALYGRAFEAPPGQIRFPTESSYKPSRSLARAIPPEAPASTQVSKNKCCFLGPPTP